MQPLPNRKRIGHVCSDTPCGIVESKAVMHQNTAHVVEVDEVTFCGGGRKLPVMDLAGLARGAPLSQLPKAFGVCMEKEKIDITLKCPAISLSPPAFSFIMPART